MASYIALSPLDLVDGISSTLIPASATTSAIGGERWVPSCECSRWRFTATGPNISLKLARDANGTVGATNLNAVEIFDGRGVLLGSITPTNSAITWNAFTLPGAGPYTFEIQNGLMGVSGPAYIGTHVLGVAGTGLALSPVTPSRRLVCVADSEFTSCNSLIGVNDVMSLLRSVYPGRVSCEAGGGAVTATQWSNSATLAARVALHAKGSNSFDVLYWLGTNDYTGQLASIQATCTANFTALVALPGISKLVVLTPIVRGTETGARTLGQYRTDITAAVAAVASPKIVVVDGSVIPLNTSTDYIETPASAALHPNDAGSLKVFAPLRTALGI